MSRKRSSFSAAKKLAIINAADKLGVYSFRLGKTDLAEIREIDIFTPQLLVEPDAKMIQELNGLGYFKHILLTIFGNGFGDRIVKN